MTLQSKKSPDPLAPPAFLVAEEIRRATFVRQVEIHDTLGSTNNRASELARDTNIELPALVVARLQTAGRGRGANKWWSADGALTFSLLIDPAAHGVSTANWPQLSLATAVAICDSIELRIADCRLRIDECNPQSEIRNPKSSLRLGIKWPNDVLLDNRKLAGILLESPGGAAPAKDRLILGIGMNVNNSCRLAPPDAAVNGIALCDVVDRPHDVQKLLERTSKPLSPAPHPGEGPGRGVLKPLLINLLNAIATRITQLSSGDTRLVGSWRQLNHFAGQNVAVDRHGQLTAGRCVEIAADGALVIETAHGQQRFVSGSVRLDQ